MGRECPKNHQKGVKPDRARRHPPLRVPGGNRFRENESAGKQPYGRVFDSFPPPCHPLIPRATRDRALKRATRSPAQKFRQTRRAPPAPKGRGPCRGRRIPARADQPPPEDRGLRQSRQRGARERETGPWL